MDRRASSLVRVFFLLAVVLAPAQARAADKGERAVYLAGGLSGDDLVTLTANLAASGRGGVPLLDTPATSSYTAGFLASFRPERVVPVGTFPEGTTVLQRRLGVALAPPLAWQGGLPESLWEALFERAERVVVCPSEPRRLLLQSACLAGAAGAPLFVARGDEGEAAALRRWLARWKTGEVMACGNVAKLCRDLGETRVTALADETEVATAYLRLQARKGPLATLVVANPADLRKEFGGTSRLAPWLALQKRAALLLTNAAGDDVPAVVKEALKNPHLRRADSLILAGNLKALPVEKRANPAEGKDSVIEMEPLTSTGEEAFTFATGRLFHDDLNVVALMLARERLVAEAKAPRRVLVASNPGGGLPLLEMFSRHTAKEFRGRGYETTALFEAGVNKDLVRRLLPDQDVFLWEGHHKTMVEEYEVPKWTEPLRPSLVVLQSCLALNEEEAFPLLRRGAVAVIGSSTRTYSGSGGAFTLAFFDGLMYEDQTLGGALRQAKNFLLAYSMLKEKRLGDGAKLKGANLRSAWAFSLWGDPTLRLPLPAVPEGSLPPVRHEVKGKTITLSVPEKAYDPVKSEKFQARMWPNARLAGLLTRDEEGDERHLVPLLFMEVALPKVPADRTPTLHGRLSEKNWVFLWDARRRSGYLLVRPPSREQRELRFSVKWDE